MSGFRARRARRCILSTSFEPEVDSLEASSDGEHLEDEVEHLDPSSPSTIDVQGHSHYDRSVAKRRKLDLEDCPLLTKLPSELRCMIYRELFLDTRIAHGLMREREIWHFNQLECIRLLPCLESLSLLSTCHLIRDEIGDSWLSQVLFHFEGIETLLDKLSSISIEQLSKIRRLRLGTCPGSLRLWANGKEVSYNPVQALKLLPGLKLDTLTILSNSHGTVGENHALARTLIAYGEGWKELQIVTHEKVVLLNEFMAKFNLRKPQQTGSGDVDSRASKCRHSFTFLEDILHRDGSASEPSVALFGCPSDMSSRACTVLNRATRVSLTLTDIALRTAHWLLTWTPEPEQQVMIIAKRGKGVDYQEKAGSPFLQHIRDIQCEFPAKSWAEIKRDHFKWPFRVGVCHYRDSYEHADEYEWPQVQ